MGFRVRKKFLLSSIALCLISAVLFGCGSDSVDLKDMASDSIAQIKDESSQDSEAAFDNTSAADKQNNKKKTDSTKPDSKEDEEIASDDDLAEEIEIVENPVQKYSTLSTWAAYWDYATAIEEIDALGDELDTVVCFEALYGSDGRTILHPEGCDALLDLLKANYSGKKTIYLSYTNDCQNPDGSYTQKSVDLLRAVFSSDAAIDQYSSEMVADCKSAGVDGLELDYENMRKDDSLFAGYAQFISALAHKCSEAGLSFRVATEYQSGIKCMLPDGPEYVVMCYNLYGYGTEPGPKADAAYLGQCFDNFAYLSHVNFAFSLGGFKWNDGNISALTENEALALLATSGAQLSYEPSGGAYYSFNEADGSASTVFYADANTINTWKNLLKSKGANAFSLWRLGGNNIDSLRGIK